MNDNGMLKPALISGVLLGILSVIPVVNLFNCFCCAWVIGGGVLAAHLYVKNSPTAVTLGSGVALGLLTGAIGAIVDTLFSIPLQLLMRNMGAGFIEQARQAIEELPNLPPETRSILDSLMANPGRLNGLFLILGGLLNLIVFSLVAMLGGVLGVALFEKRKIDRTGSYQPPVNLPPPPPPPPDAGNPEP